MGGGFAKIVSICGTPKAELRIRAKILCSLADLKPLKSCALLLGHILWILTQAHVRLSGRTEGDAESRTLTLGRMGGMPVFGFWVPAHPGSKELAGPPIAVDGSPLELVARTVPPSPGSWQSLLGSGHLNIPQDRHWSLYLDSLCQYPPPRRKKRLSSLLARSETSKRPLEAARPPFAQETDILATLALLFLRASKLGGKHV